MILEAFGLLAGLIPQLGPVQDPPPGVRTGGGTTAQPRRLDYPVDADVDRCAPFLDPWGQPASTEMSAVGSADLDADGNRDLWFLSATTYTYGELSVQMARTSSLGRYRPWHNTGPSNWNHAATFHAPPGAGGERILLVDTMSSTLSAVSYRYPPESPRAGSFVVENGWSVGRGGYEIATRDDDGDGIDDIALLMGLKPGWTQVKKLRMGATGSRVTPRSTTVFNIPGAAQHLRMLDFDADGLSDVLVLIPRAGLLLLRDDGQSLLPTAYIPFSGVVADAFVGDADRDGRDDFGLVGGGGVLMALSRPTGPYVLGLGLPGQIGPLGSARVLGDGLGNLTSVVAFAADGRGLALYPWIGAGLFGPPIVRVPQNLTAFGGVGPGPVHLVVEDLDGDGDQDVLTQLPDRAHWLRLRDDEVDLRPSGVQIEDLGMVGEATGFRQFRIVAQFPPEALARPQTAVEMAVFIEDITLAVPVHVYWGRLIGEIDPGTGSVSFVLHSQTDKTKLKAMIQSRTVFPYPGGIGVGGETVISIHLRDLEEPRRYESIIVHHDGGGSGGRSALGIRWDVRDSPPRSEADDDLLPWH